MPNFSPSWDNLWGDSSSDHLEPLDHLATIRAPNESFGLCRNISAQSTIRRCRQFNPVELGNGYCVVCWDAGLGSKEPEDWDWQPDS